MARINELQVGRFNRLAQKLFSMKGTAAVPTLDPDLHLMIPLFHGVENRYLEAWDQFEITITTPAVAAQLGLVELRNPAGSNVIVVVEQAEVCSINAADTPGQAGFGYNSGVTGAVTTDQQVVSIAKVVLDPRGRSFSTAVLSSTNAAPVGIGGFLILQGWVAQGGTLRLNPTGQYELPILPGGALNLQGFQVNTSTGFNLRWRERFLEDSERK